MYANSDSDIGVYIVPPFSFKYDKELRMVPKKSMIDMHQYNNIHVDTYMIHGME